MNVYHSHISCALLSSTFAILTLTGSAQDVNCNTSYFTVAYADIPPYTFHARRGTNASIQGAITHVAKKAVEHCCGPDVHLIYDQLHDNLREVEESLDDQHVAFPVVKTALTILPHDIRTYYFLPVMETVGSMLVMHNKYSASNPVAHSLASCWPLTILVISSAGLAGIIVWALDRYWNPEEFPKPFLSGCWEGTWWAYVTMTTVGYGDRAPKSIPARAFGLLWMLGGIILMSIFTATLSAALTSNEAEQFALKGAKIGVRNGSIEQLLAYREGAKVTVYITLAEMLQALEDLEVEGALIDINLAMYAIAEINGAGAYFERRVDNKAVYGIIFQGQPDYVEQCFARQVSKSQFRVYDDLLQHVSQFEKNTVSQASQTTQNAMSGIYTILIVTSVFWLFAFFVCILWDCLYYRKKVQGLQNKIENKEELLCAECQRNKVNTAEDSVEGNNLHVNKKSA